MKRQISKFEKYMYTEIGIEFKAFLYFYAIMFFYSVYKVICGSFDANIIYMAEIIMMTYIMGYVQVYLLNNVDEAQQLGIREIIYMIGCSLIYAAASYLGKWFDKNIYVSIGFFFYILFTYICAYLIYKLRRNIDEKMMNDDLKAFQSRNKEN